MSERRACGLTDICRAMVRYQARVREDGPVRRRLLEVAALRKRFGYPRLGCFLDVS
jgi:putative transposase